MAPQVPVHTIDRTSEYEQFIHKLTEFHRQRGTSFDPAPKLGVCNVDLLKLFNHIVSHGGYDAVSDEKLAWRKMCENLGLMTSNPPAAAFSLKSIFYKYLAAYEIKAIHNKEPPPPEILEHTTAKGSGLLTRTLENYAPSRRETTAHKDSDGDDGTPARERPSEDTPGSARASRGLRQDPPQRVIFQPETSSSRPRHASGQHANMASHSAHHTPHSQPHTTSHQMQQQQQASYQTSRGYHMYTPQTPDLQNPSVAAYEPARVHVLPMRAVETPANNPEGFANARRLARLQAAGKPATDSAQQRKPPALPGFEGPNIYMRCLMSLLSCIPAEQAFALNHLVKISFERGDKFRFEQFPKLVEGLVQKALEVGNLFYEVEWTIKYDPDRIREQIGELDGNEGTADILERICRLQPKRVIDGIIPGEFADSLNMITEAVLTIRNMVMLQDNALHIADFPMLKDLLCIILNLPRLEICVELKHFALDIAEQVTPYLILGDKDPLYQTLLSQLVTNSDDRGVVLTALRAVGRISMNLAEPNTLNNVPAEVLQRVKDWLLLNDDELLDACLDFLYQYTAVVANMETLIKATTLQNIVNALVRLLSHGAKREQREVIIEPERRIGGTDDVATPPQELIERLLAMEEPQRCHTWIRCFFEEEPDGEVTQIAIWQAYNTAFLELLKKSGRAMIQAAEFIRSISTVYQNATAKIVRNQGPSGEVTRFIIEGIRFRNRPVSPEGVEYFPCLWARKDRRQGEPPKCFTWIAGANNMWDHIMRHHLSEGQDPETGGYQDKMGKYICYWAACSKYREPTELRSFVFSSHVKLHALQAFKEKNQSNVDAQTPGGTLASKRTSARPYVVPAKTIALTVEETVAVPVDPRNPTGPQTAGGIPLSATLVLRNIARNVMKTEAQEELAKQGEESWNECLFRSHRMRFYEIMAMNKLLGPHAATLLQAINDQPAGHGH